MILLATLSPARWTERKDGPVGQDSAIADMLMNAALFAPLGVALALQRRSAAGAVLFGALLSGTVETIQMAVPGRVSSLSDVTLNGLGTLAGWAIWRTSPIWVRPEGMVADRLVLAAGSFATTILGLTGFLLGPDFPATRYFGGWTHDFGHLQSYRGQVLEASVGGVNLPPGRIPHSADVRTRLRGRETLRLRAIAGPPANGLAPLLSVHDEHQHEVLLLGVDGSDVVYRYRTRAAALGLDSPALRVPGALRGLQPGDPLAVVIAHRNHGECVAINGVTVCGVGFTLGMGWALLLSSQVPLPWIQGVLNALWLAGLTLPIGYWARAGSAWCVSATLVAVALVLLPSATGHLPTPAAETGAALIGSALGVLLRRWVGTREPATRAGTVGEART